MHHAKKQVLVDPEVFEQIQADREFKRLQRPADAVARTSLSLDIRRILDQNSISEDQQVKQVQDLLRRYHNVRSEIPTESNSEPNSLLSLPPQPLPPLPVQAKAEKKKKRGQRRQASPIPLQTTRTKRQRRPPLSSIPWVSY